MKVIKNINNNVSLCFDSRNEEVVVFGKGVGFIKPPADIPLAKIERTFYKLDSRFVSLLNDIPIEILDFTAEKLANIVPYLPYETNSNLILTLADHLAFALERVRKGIYVPLPSVYEMEISYPLEVKIGREIVDDFQNKFKTTLPKGEVQGVAMHFINARGKQAENIAVNEDNRFEMILEESTSIIEKNMNIVVNRESFNYARFATHIQYLLKRAFDHKHIDSANVELYKTIQNEYELVSDCVNEICIYLKDKWDIVLTQEEKLYLIMHVNRVCSKEVN